MTHLVLAFDFGMKYIGIAVGTPITKTANPITTVRAIDGIPNWQEITNIIAKWQPQELLVGLPLQLDGSEQFITKCANKFAARLRGRYKLPVHMIDETFSTLDAKQNIGDNRKLNAINAEAAAIILRTWLNNN